MSEQRPKGVSPAVAAREIEQQKRLSGLVALLMDTLTELEDITIGKTNRFGRPKHTEGGHRLQLKHGFLYLHCSAFATYTLNATVTSKSPYYPLNEKLRGHPLEVLDLFYGQLMEKYGTTRTDEALRAEARDELRGPIQEMPSNPGLTRGLEGPSLND